MSDISLYFDVVSPYSYFAFCQRARIRATGHELKLRPASVRAIMERTGNVPTTITCAPKTAYTQQDMVRWARRLNLSIKLHPEFGGFDSEPLLAAVVAAGGKGEVMAQAAFEAVWLDHPPVKDADAMRAFFDGKLKGGGSFWDDRDKALPYLERNNADAVEAGAFGVPLFVAPTGLYFGNDRIDILIEDLST